MVILREESKKYSWRWRRKGHQKQVQTFFPTVVGDVGCGWHSPVSSPYATWGQGLPGLLVPVGGEGWQRHSSPHVRGSVGISSASGFPLGAFKIPWCEAAGGRKGAQLQKLESW